MHKRLVLLVITLIVVLALIPAHYPPDDEALRQPTSLSDLSPQLFTVTGTFPAFDHHQDWTGVLLSLEIYYCLPQNIVLPAATRAPPA
jgi:hypothetical protein